MRISDWSSDVCSSDLAPRAALPGAGGRRSPGAADAGDLPRAAAAFGAGAASDGGRHLPAGAGPRPAARLCRLSSPDACGRADHLFPLSLAGWGVREGAAVLLLGVAGLAADAAPIGRAH